MKISIGIPTYNDKNTVGKLLFEILKQKQIGYELLEVIVVNDGSTNGTDELCEKIATNNDKIVVIHLSSNEGKANALNIIFKEAEGDVLVLFDADCAIGDDKLICKLVEPFNEENLGLVSGWFRSEKSKRPNLIERRYIFFNQVLFKLNSENKSLLAANGRIMAISKHLYKYVYMPEKTIGTDVFLYLHCLNEGFNFLFNKNALVTRVSPKNFMDMVKYRKRALRSYRDNMLRFGVLAEKEFNKVTSLLLKYLFKGFINNPIQGINCIVMELVAFILTIVSKEKVTYLWRR